MSKRFKDLVESRISIALAAGAFDNLPGQGKPLDLREDPLVPEELRIGNRILKNAGVVPPELEKFKQDGAAEEPREPAKLSPGRRRLLALRLRGLSLSGEAGSDYQQAIINRLTKAR